MSKQKKEDTKYVSFFLVPRLGEKRVASLTILIFNGTMEQWGEIYKDSDWYEDIDITVVHCADGDVDVSTV